MSYLEYLGVLTGAELMFQKFSESEQESWSVEQEWGRSLKNVTPLISGSLVVGSLSAGFPNLFLAMYPFSIPTDEYVPLQHFTR